MWVDDACEAQRASGLSAGLKRLVMRRRCLSMLTQFGGISLPDQRYLERPKQTRPNANKRTNDLLRGKNSQNMRAQGENGGITEIFYLRL